MHPPAFAADEFVSATPSSGHARIVASVPLLAAVCGAEPNCVRVERSNAPTALPANCCAFVAAAAAVAVSAVVACVACVAESAFFATFAALAVSARAALGTCLSRDSLISVPPSVFLATSPPLMVRLTMSLEVTFKAAYEVPPRATKRASVAMTLAYVRRRRRTTSTGDLRSGLDASFPRDAFATVTRRLGDTHQRTRSIQA